MPTKGECKEGADFNYKGEWGYHVLVVSLANTQSRCFWTTAGGTGHHRRVRRHGWTKRWRWVDVLGFDG